jgi:hypothetical protein
MTELIIFAGLLGIVAGCIHLYHCYVIRGHETKHVERLDGIRSQLSDLRIELAGYRKRLKMLETTHTEVRYTRGAEAEYGGDAIANEDDDMDNQASDPMGSQSVWDQVDSLRQNAQERFDIPAEERIKHFRKVLPTSALGPGRFDQD